MREYRFQATDQTVEALRKLRTAWHSLRATELTCTIALASGEHVRVEVDTVDVEGVFDAYRLAARVLSAEEVEAERRAGLDYSRDGVLQSAALGARANGVANGNGRRSASPLPVESLANGNNDVVLFSGVSWSEPAGTAAATGLSPNAVLQFSGHLGQLSPTAEIVCITTDAFVVASERGEGVLFRTGLKPESIELVTDTSEVRAFLLQRGYGQDDA